MKILILNRGSSSIKCCLFDLDYLPDTFTLPLWEARIKWKNAFSGISLFINGKQQSQPFQCSTGAEALEQLVNVLPGSKKVDCIGHRIVHGGTYFDKTVFIDPDVKAKIQQLADLAPLHNQEDLEGIEMLERHFPHVPQVAVFDTAFHRNLPLAAAMYPGSYRWLDENVRRYGFHGTSFQYCSKRASQILACPLETIKMVICHLGSGASLCAIRGGQGIDTTMGFTPLDGLMMDTRCGSIDPGILLYFIKKGKTYEELTEELYHESGLLGLSGFSSDMRDIIEQSAAGHPHAAMAFEVYMHRLISCLGSMIASLGGAEALVFTAGIGENASVVRKKVCEAFAFLGCKLDEKKNNMVHEEDCILSAPDSEIKVLLVHTREAFEIARECWKIMAVSKQKPSE